MATLHSYGGRTAKGVNAKLVRHSIGKHCPGTAALHCLVDGQDGVVGRVWTVKQSSDMGESIIE